MSEDHDPTLADPPKREWLLERFARWFEPYGILIAVCALFAAFATLGLEFDLRDATLTALKQEKELREKTLTAMDEEKELRSKTLAALEQEKLLREASLLAMLADRLEVANEEKAPYAGHVPILERLARLGLDLRNIDMSGIRFDVDGGIDLSGADLSHVSFGGADLVDAKLADANLTKARFRRAKLHGVDLRNANLTEAYLRQANLTRANLGGALLKNTNLRDTDLTNADFQNARGLIQRKLDEACADPEDPPINLPRDDGTGDQLVWKGRTCEE
ncbi:MAG: pentapeptide repeat-containing protein [Gammaproteobacteria bacterium]|nr:pentapeptide repeat-containing protein [Gammaproteobacteria bacterium]